MRRRLFFDDFSQALLAGHWEEDNDPIKFSNSAIIGGAMQLAKLGNDDGAIAREIYKNAMPVASYAVQSVTQTDNGGWSFVMGRLGGTGTTDDHRGGYYLILAYTSSIAPANWDLTLVANTIYLVKRDPNTGAETVLDSATFALSVSTDYVLRLVMRGTSLEGYVDGVLLVSATDTTLTRPGYIGVGFAAKLSSWKCDHDDVSVRSLVGQSAHRVQMVFDESRRHLWILRPKSGQEIATEQDVYDLEHDEWMRRDHAISGFGIMPDSRGEQRIVFGNGSGRVNLLDGSTTWPNSAGTAAAFTGTWESNWLDLGSDLAHKTIAAVVIDLVRQATDAGVKLTVSVADHPDGKVRSRSFGLHTRSGWHRFGIGVGGRYLRFKFDAPNSGVLEIRQLAIEMDEPRESVPDTDRR